jgi:hypothetical protein
VEPSLAGLPPSPAVPQDAKRSTLEARAPLQLLERAWMFALEHAGHRQDAYATSAAALRMELDPALAFGILCELFGFIGIPDS